MDQSTLKEVRKIRRLSRAFVRELGVVDAAFKSAEIPLSQCHSLVELEEHGSLTQTELANNLKVDKAAMSRVIVDLEENKWIEVVNPTSDLRKKALSLTKEGKSKLESIHTKADAQVLSALALLSSQEREVVSRGLALYTNALAKSRSQKDYTIGLIEKGDTKALQLMIKRVTAGLGILDSAIGRDEEIENAYKAFTKTNSAYFVVKKGEELVGGSGISPASKSKTSCCELKLMYLLPQARGIGLGERLVRLCLEKASGFGFNECYIETSSKMKAAIGLYEKLGFRRLEKQHLQESKKRPECNYAFLKRL